MVITPVKAVIRYPEEVITLVKAGYTTEAVITPVKTVIKYPEAVITSPMPVINPPKPMTPLQNQ
ncbi:hypothetical protein [Filibacter tadaridae]|uniref:hypothetical protein n=1 Tax=Filibacter tadaridae TaxID=2483811 RepID=UPI000F52CCEA|nr:hypothetical protein [Filibacter tadaridae]